MWLYHWCEAINELLQNLVLDLIYLFCCLLRQCPNSTPVVPKVGGIAPLGAVRNSRGAVKQKWAIGGQKETRLIITFLLS